MERTKSVSDLPTAQDSEQHTPGKKSLKRRRRHSSEAAGSHGTGAAGGSRGRHPYHYRPAHKKPRLGGGHGRSHGYKRGEAIVSSKSVAEKIMRTRLRGSVSDPLNLEGGGEAAITCNSCMPSPSLEERGQHSPPPECLIHDPLNLEGKVKSFPTKLKGSGAEKSGSHSRHGRSRKRTRRRTVSQSEVRERGGNEEGGGGGKGGEEEEEEGGGDIRKRETEMEEGREEEGKGKGRTKQAKEPSSFNPKNTRYCYGNYDKYYGYRNNGVFEEDMRLGLLRKEWFENKDCLDIGCNTGQVTIRLAKDMSPRRIVGVDIDGKLIRMAWKNLHRYYVPATTPDGRPFPVSLTMARGPVSLLRPGGGGGGGRGEGQERKKFPHNVEFVEANYLPETDDSLSTVQPEYDVILGLSLTKWVHLNWGDDGLKRLFRKVYRHLRPGGVFILEPQPFKSYGRRKHLTPTLYENYHRIQFFPKNFQAYLTSTEVGFSKHEFLGTPHNKSKGFRRPLHLYMKTRDTSLPTNPERLLGLSTPSGDVERQQGSRHGAKSVSASHLNSVSSCKDKASGDTETEMKVVEDFETMDHSSEGGKAGDCSAHCELVEKHEHRSDVSIEQQAGSHSSR